jgi:excisionase family DNA binding protein
MPNRIRAEMSPNRACFRVSSLAERWDCSAGKVRDMIKSGALPCLRLGNMVRIPVSAVYEFEAKCQDQTHQDSAALPVERPGTSITSASASLRAARIEQTLKRYSRAK